MADVTTLRGAVLVETENAQKGLRDTQAEFEKTARAADRASGSFGNAGKAVDGLGQLLRKAGLAVSLAAVTHSLIGVGQQSVELALEMQTNEISFRTLIGSVEGATKHLEDLKQFALNTPFQFNELVDASKRMQAFGFEASKVIPMMTDIGDAAAALGSGQVGINRMVTALGQMQAKGRVMGQELLQLTEAGVPALRYLAESAGTTTGEMSKLVEKGLVPADQAIQAILAGARQDFGGLMAEQAKTAAGQISNLEDAWKSFLTMVGRETTDELGAASSALAMFLRGYEQALTVDLTDMAQRGGVRDTIKIMYAQAALQQSYGDTTAAMKTYAEATDLMAEHTVNARVKLSSLEVAPGPQFFADIAAGMREVGEASVNLGYAGMSADALKQKLADLNSYITSNLSSGLETGAEKVKTLEEKKAELRAEIDRLTLSNGQYYTSTKESGLSDAEREVATLKLAEAQAKLSEETDPLKQAELRVAIEKQQEKLADTTVTVEGYINNSKKISELEEEYQVVEDAIGDVKEATEDQTRRMIFNMLQQRLALDGVTAEEYEFLLRVANGMGIVDQAAFDAGMAMDEVVKDLETGGLTAEQAATKVWGYANALLGIPAQIKTEVTVHYKNIGTPPPGYTKLGEEVDDDDFSPPPPPPPPGGGGGDDDDDDKIIDGKLDIASAGPDSGSGSGDGVVVNMNFYGAQDANDLANKVIAIWQDRGLLSRTGVR